MITTAKFNYQPHESELERASNSYLMSLVAVIGGLPLPILNLMASIFFYLGNRKSTAFVKWHCTQALVSQLGLFFFNSAGFWWTMSILFQDGEATNYYFAYIITLVVFTVFSLVAFKTETFKWNHLLGFFFLVLAVYFIFKK